MYLKKCVRTIIQKDDVSTWVCDVYSGGSILLARMKETKIYIRIIMFTFLWKFL